jgi:hypothetical protein
MGEVMADKCKKLTRTLQPCDALAFATSNRSLVLQTLHSRETGMTRERVVLPTKKGDMPLWYCPFCRIDITIPAAQAERERGE